MSRVSSERSWRWRKDEHGSGVADRGSAAAARRGGRSGHRRGDRRGQLVDSGHHDLDRARDVDDGREQHHDEHEAAGLHEHLVVEHDHHVRAAAEHDQQHLDHHDEHVNHHHDNHRPTPALTRPPKPGFGVDRSCGPTVPNQVLASEFHLCGEETTPKPWLSHPSAGIARMDPDAILAAHAEAHHSVFKVVHAQMAGLSRRQIEQRVDKRRWVQLHQGVFRLSGVPISWEGTLLAACWAGGARAVASRRCAAALHGLPGGRRDLIEITCPRWRRARHDGLTVYETKALDRIDVVLVAGIPVTSPARTLFDLGAVCRRGLVELALENALRRNLVQPAELVATVNRLSRSGRPGGPILRELLAARTPDRRPTESEMETLLLQSLRAHGLAEPIPQYNVWNGPLHVGRVDAAYPAAKIAIEYDSDEFHSGRAATAHDRARRHELIAASWLPIDVGPLDLRRGGKSACAAISQALVDRGPTTTVLAS
jgi:hypothetical protein